MFNYFSTLIPGTADLTTEFLLKMYPQTKILSRGEDLLVYKSDALPQDIKQLRFFNNSFLLIKSFGKLGHNPLQSMINQSTGNVERAIREYAAGKRRSVRIMFYEENQGVSLPEPIKAKVEQSVVKSRNVFINRKGANIEVWYLAKRDNTGYLGIRLTEFGDYEKNLQPGELKPQLAHLLCLLSSPQATDTVLDPFCGSGRIALERTYFKYKEIIALDNDKKLIDELTVKVVSQNKKITVQLGDATNLSQIPDNSISKIITDPPWGEFEKTRYDLDTLYNGFLKEFTRVLIPNSIIIILTGQKEILQKSITQIPELQITNKYDILVSGKKAAIFKIIKT
jgi:DNA modification methylase